MAKKVKTAKNVKAPKATRKQRATRPQVVSFRITTGQTKTLGEIFNRDAASGVNSPNQLARKIVCDYLAGRLVYRNPDDKLVDMDTVGATG